MGVVTKRILLPTDFSVESLNVLKHAARNNTTEGLQVVFLYCCRQPESISRLLFYSPERELLPIISNDFKEACSILRNKYPQGIHSIYYKTFHGSNQTSFNNFLEGERIAEIYIPKKYAFKLNGNSFDSLPFVRRSRLPIYEADWVQNGTTTIKESLAKLFAE